MINCDRLAEILSDCMFQESELVDGVPVIEPVKVEGILHNFGFHPDRVCNHKQEIISMVNELPDAFTKGWSFLNMCVDKEGNQWTGLHIVMEQLLALGLAINKISYCLPKHMWHLLPGNMPYIQVWEESCDVCKRGGKYLEYLSEECNEK